MPAALLNCNHLQFLAEWNGAHTLSLDHKVTSICWNRSGTCLLTGGTSLILWEYNPPLLNLDEISSEVELNKGEGQEDAGGRGEEEEREKRSPLKELWRCEVSNPLFHLKFSPSGDLFASCGKVSQRPQQERGSLSSLWYCKHYV